MVTNFLHKDYYTKRRRTKRYKRQYSKFQNRDAYNKKFGFGYNLSYEHVFYSYYKNFWIVSKLLQYIKKKLIQNSNIYKQK